MYWIRHIVLTWVQFGFAVAQAYAGHEDRGRGARSMAAMATYVRAGLPEVATALPALTGEPHRLAITPSDAVGANREREQAKLS
jgi:integrase/recombinase XerC